ncbi:proline-rich protein 36-like [Helianthus annuus]|uniref:proline-rich protein 36-like n=1 Tax=Helianthus annuus TaxID=4232 RepID=UPI000B8F9731|nr:proline-rich protein 36-like [Helianthus annuus]
MDSSGIEGSDTTDRIHIVSDDRESSEREVYTSDTSTDDDDFQPFALPNAVIEPADGPITGDLPLVEIPAPIPLAMYPVIGMPLDVVVDDNVDLFDEEPLEDDVEGETLIAADDLLLLADAPAEESPAHSPIPDSFESVASAPSHAQGAQHYSHDSDPDRASSAAPAPAPSFAIDHDIDEDSDLVFPPGFDPDQDIEFIHLDQPMEDLVDPVDPAFADPADFEMEFDDPEPAVIAPHIVDIPAEPDVVAPFPDPVPLEPDHALFATHVDPQYAHTRNGWTEDDDDFPPFVVPVTPVSAPASAPFDAPLFHTYTADAHRTDLPITFLQEIPPPRPGEGSSRQPFGHAPFLSGGDQFVPRVSHHTAVPPVAPFTVPPLTPASEPFLWISPPIMPPSDPYHPFHMGYSVEDILMLFMIQHEALTRRVQELERAQRPSSQCPPHPAISHPPRPLSPDSAARF